ncbi:hypothetical protein PM082_017198 [Marasmius tenuissimus]|nr:hypothetical protein PM082_017198 [Marasmius tenuissimus]
MRVVMVPRSAVNTIHPPLNSRRPTPRANCSKTYVLSSTDSATSLSDQLWSHLPSLLEAHVSLRQCNNVDPNSTVSKRCIGTPEMHRPLKLVTEPRLSPTVLSDLVSDLDPPFVDFRLSLMQTPYLQTTPWNLHSPGSPSLKLNCRILVVEE